jgi:hypothetical protein
MKRILRIDADTVIEVDESVSPEVKRAMIRAALAKTSTVRELLARNRAVRDEEERIKQGRRSA